MHQKLYSLVNANVCDCLFILLYFVFAQDELDSLSPVLRDNPQLHEEVKSWVKDQKVQEIFMQGKTL